jgi:hypothetical protein
MTHEKDSSLPVVASGDPFTSASSSMAEQETFNLKVQGSSPWGRTG